MCIRDRDYILQIISTVLLALNFAVTKAYQQKEGTSLEKGLQFNIIPVSYTHLDVYKRQNKEPTQTYVDVSPERWSFVYVESAKQRLPVDADLPINEFSPEKQYTREEVAAAAVMSLGLADGNIINKNVLTEHFTDADQTAPSLAGLVGIAAERGILQGADKLIRPKATVTRAEAVSYTHLDVYKRQA